MILLVCILDYIKQNLKRNLTTEGNRCERFSAFIVHLIALEWRGGGGKFDPLPRPSLIGPFSPGGIRAAVPAIYTNKLKQGWRLHVWWRETWSSWVISLSFGDCVHVQLFRSTVVVVVVVGCHGNPRHCAHTKRRLLLAFPFKTGFPPSQVFCFTFNQLREKKNPTRFKNDR